MQWEGKSIPLFAVTIAMIVLPLAIVPLRCYVRITRKSFKLDDWLIIAALLFHLGASAVTLWGFTHGLAMPDEYLSAEDRMRGVQTFAMYKPLYTLATCLIKCSICFTFLRLSTSPKIRRSLHWILYIVSGSSLVMFIGSFVYCVPYPAIWKHWQHPHTPGYCLPGAVVLTVGYSFACVTIATDLACAIIPGVILWQTVMSTRNMCLAWGILGLGFLAGIMTACRLPYIAYWVHTSNQSYGLGRILLFELLECGLGIFASCAPALKPWVSASMTSFSSFLHRFSRWTTIHSTSDHSQNNHKDVEKAIVGLRETPAASEIPETRVTPPRMALVIPDIEDTIIEPENDSIMDDQDKDCYSNNEEQEKASVIMVSGARPESGEYWNKWQVSREDKKEGS